MTHMGPMKDSDGEFKKPEERNGFCRSCKSIQVIEMHEWESNCGGYVDHKYVCKGCGHTWWVDGPDA